MSTTTTDVTPVRVPAREERQPRIVPLRHPGRWVGVAVALVLLAQLAHALVTNPGLDWPTFRA
jgi:polar amino acid transport system permease protein